MVCTLKKNGKLPSGETITEVAKHYRKNNWAGLITSCVSLEIVEQSCKELKKLNIPFGFKANLWNVDEPLPVHKFNRAKFNEIGVNPNILMGIRKEITDEKFYNFTKKIMNKGATILGGCCEVRPSHIKEISKLR